MLNFEKHITKIQAKLFMTAGKAVFLKTVVKRKGIALEGKFFFWPC